MNNTVLSEQIRKKGLVYYRVNEVKNDSVVCQTRNGPRGRFTTSLTRVELPEFETFDLVRDAPNGNGNGNGKVTVRTSIQKPPLWTPEDLDDDEVIKSLIKENQATHRKLRKAKIQQRLIIESIRNSFDKLPDIYVPKLPKPSNKTDEEIAVLHISDTQIGKVTDSYNSAIARERLFQLIKTTLKITECRRSAAKIDEIHVYLGGDMVEGEEIFAHQAHTIEESVYDQATKTAVEILGKCILMLVQSFRKVKVLCVPGNHGRNGSRATHAHPKTNWDSVCYATLQCALLGTPWNPRKELEGRLEFDYQDSWYVVDRVFDWGNLVVHGDQISGGYAGFPWYGTGKKAWGWIDSIPAPWDYLWFGHFHTYAGPVTLNRRIFLCNGTTESDNTFAQEKLAAAGHPCQRLCFFNKEHGLISDNQIFLDKRIPSKARATNWAEV